MMLMRWPDSNSLIPPQFTLQSHPCVYWSTGRWSNRFPFTLFPWLKCQHKWWILPLFQITGRPFPSVCRQGGHISERVVPGGRAVQQVTAHLCCYAKLCYPMLCSVMLCHIMLCCVLLCCVMLSYAMLWLKASHPYTPSTYTWSLDF